ncbi:MAG: hypothetical protein HKN24_06780 [Acidimicrobiales bacterium]|nr:hypothetical protein [Acidimicrobiales bacterium]
MSDRYSKLAPRDLVITMRSLSRRFDEALGPVRSDPERFARRDELIDGASLTGHVEGLARHLGLLEQEIFKLTSEGDPVINGEALASTPPPAAVDRSIGLDAAQAALAASADAIGTRLDGVSSEQWSFRAPASNGIKVMLADVAQHAARVGAEGLRETQRLIDRI